MIGEDGQAPAKKAEDEGLATRALASMLEKLDSTVYVDQGVEEGEDMRSQLSGACLQRLEFSLRTMPSEVEGAGQGVFLNLNKTTNLCPWRSSNCVRSGSVVCLYPGTVYTSAESELMAMFTFVGNDYLLRLPLSGCVIDGSEEGHSAKTMSSLLARDKNSTNKRNTQCGGFILPSVNPLALGHKVNHPPKGTTPNVRLVEVDWRHIPSTFHRWRPTVAFTANTTHGIEKELPAASSSHVGAAFVAIRDIHDGEELFLDYKFQGETPSWYHHVLTEDRHAQRGKP